jgi:hypothetical protein
MGESDSGCIDLVAYVWEVRLNDVVRNEVTLIIDHLLGPGPSCKCVDCANTPTINPDCF